MKMTEEAILPNFGAYPEFGIYFSMKMIEEAILLKFGTYPKFGILFFEFSEMDFLFLT